MLGGDWRSGESDTFPVLSRPNQRPREVQRDTKEAHEFQCLHSIENTLNYHSMFEILVNERYQLPCLIKLLFSRLFRLWFIQGWSMSSRINKKRRKITKNKLYVIKMSNAQRFLYTYLKFNFKYTLLSKRPTLRLHFTCKCASLSVTAYFISPTVFLIHIFTALMFFLKQCNWMYVPLCC
jgi:hypothetical protein